MLHNTKILQNPRSLALRIDSTNASRFTKVKIVVSPDYHFTIITMIDSDVDMNCIQEGLIPSKYFEKSTERLVSANGS